MGRADSYIPSLKYGHKIYPENIAGMLGLPSVGEIFYVDAASGSDSAGGKSRNDAFATVYTAQQAMTADQDDVLVIVGSNSTGRTSETNAIDWNKRRTHIVGNGVPRKINPRVGMSFAALGGDVCFTVSANDCHFYNISIASFTDNNVLVDVTAPYQTFDFVHFQGIANDTAGNDTAARSLRITGADENQFRNCTIGLDTVTRSTTNASLELTGVCARNLFESCDFPVFADNAGPNLVLFANNDACQRYTKFSDCWFINSVSSTTLTEAISIPAAANGKLLLDDSWTTGITDSADNYDVVLTNNPVRDAADATFLIADAQG